MAYFKNENHKIRFRLKTYLWRVLPKTKETLRHGSGGSLPGSQVTQSWAAGNRSPSCQYQLQSIFPLRQRKHSHAVLTLSGVRMTQLLASVPQDCAEKAKQCKQRAHPSAGDQKGIRNAASWESCFGGFWGQSRTKEFSIIVIGRRRNMIYIYVSLWWHGEICEERNRCKSVTHREKHLKISCKQISNKCWHKQDQDQTTKIKASRKYQTWNK